VLSEVSPPTALSSVAAAAITGGDAFKTMMLTLRYTLPAFLVPFAFVLSPNGEGLLLQGPILQIAWTLAVAALAVVALAVATGGWLLGPARPPERVLAGLASLFLLYLEPLTIAVGAGLLVAAVAVHLTLRGRPGARSRRCCWSSPSGWPAAGRAATASACRSPPAGRAASTSSTAAASPSRSASTWTATRPPPRSPRPRSTTCT
jgi:hypothetical protein